MKVLDRRQEQLRDFGELFDITSRKHGGNECSTSAHVKIAPMLRGSRQGVFDLIRDSGQRGMTCDEIAAFLGKGENAVSGRITELLRDGRIKRDGTRKTRSGCSAAILKAS